MAITKAVTGSVFRKLTGANEATGGILSMLAVFMFAVWSALVEFGGTLAYYIPMVPYMLWFFGVVGWLMMVVESVVAAPIWAAAHSMPEGGGIAGQHARNGYMLLLNVIIRPMLMLFGFFLAMLVMTAGYQLLMLTFFPAMRSVMSSSGVVGIVGLLFMLGILVHIVLVMTHRSFALIHLIAERGSRWIGGGGEQLGEQEQEGQVKQGAVGFVSHTSQAGRESFMSTLDQGKGKQPDSDGDGGKPAIPDKDAIPAPVDNDAGSAQTLRQEGQMTTNARGAAGAGATGSGEAGGQGQGAADGASGQNEVQSPGQDGANTSGQQESDDGVPNKDTY